MKQIILTRDEKSTMNNWIQACGNPIGDEPKHSGYVFEKDYKEDWEDWKKQDKFLSRIREWSKQ